MLFADLADQALTMNGVESAVSIALLTNRVLPVALKEQGLTSVRRKSYPVPIHTVTLIYRIQFLAHG